MAAGVSIEAIKSMLGFDMPIIRIMPNVCASVGEAMILDASLDASDDTIADFCNFMAQY